METPVPANEAERLKALRSYNILDTSPEEQFDNLARFAAHVCNATMASIALVDETREWFKSKIGIPAPETPREGGFCSYNILSNELLVVPDTLADSRFRQSPLVTSGPQVRFYAGMPLVTKEGVALGALCVSDQAPRGLTSLQREALTVLAQQVVAQLELRRANHELDDYRTNLEQMIDQRTRQLQVLLARIERTYDETLQALGTAIDLRDNETAGHSDRVTQYSLAIAKAMGFSDEQLRNVARGAYLHDIGKLCIPDNILLKPGKLTEEERRIMEDHVRIGYNLVSGITFLTGAVEVVLCHHERFDGMGYPQGLTGREVPRSARIFSVVDTLDAMTSNRPYRQALPFAAARQEIIQESGRQFDPKVVEAFLSISENAWIGIRREVAEQARFSRRTPLSLATAV